MSTARKGRVLLVHNVDATFVRADERILRAAFDVDVLFARSYIDPPPWSVLARVARADVAVCWFASWHAVVPVLGARILGRPSIVVTGGYDVAAIPEIGYGHQRGGLPRLLSRVVLRTATRVLPFSASAAHEAARNAGVPETAMDVVPLGVALPSSTPRDGREPLVLTVGRIDRSNLARKGLGTFARTAALVPDVTFAVVGALADEVVAAELRAAAPNVRLMGALSDAELAALYARAAAYLQLSAHEGFGMAVAEAMAAGCIPIVTRVGSLPELVGDAGTYVSDPAGAATAVRSALHAAPDRRAAAAARIRDRFALAARAQRLVAIVGELASRRRSQ